MTHGPHRTAKALPLIVTLLCGASMCLSAASAAQTKSSQWEPLRIHVSTKDIEDPARYCNETGVLRPNFEGHNFTCIERDILTDEWRRAILQEVIPAAVKLHTDRLLVQRASGPLQVPIFDKTHRCMHFTVPEEHHSPGVSNADVVLYAAVISSTIPAGYCALGSDKRPIAGYLLLTADVIHLQHTVRSTAHKIAHALGFDYNVMIHLDMVNFVDVGGRQVMVVKSPRVVEKAREHFNCSTIEGLEISRSDGFSKYHWAHAFTQGDLMTVPSDVSGFYSALTMAAFEDMGVFRVRWGMEEPMSWGKDAGCDFPPKKCTAETISKYPHMYCNRSDKRQRCGVNRLVVGKCVSSHVSAGNNVCGKVQEQRFCALQYTDDANIPFFSLTGRGSWCLDADAVVKGKDGKDEEVAGVCAKVKCDDGKVHVQYKGNSAWHACPEGGTITPTSSSFASGSIRCPKYAEVCTIAEDGSSLVKSSTTSSSSPDAGIEDSSTSTSTASNGAGGRGDGTVFGASCYGPLVLIFAAVTLLL